MGKSQRAGSKAERWSSAHVNVSVSSFQRHFKAVTEGIRSPALPEEAGTLATGTASIAESLEVAWGGTIN
ncbi:MAG: hypothetical protein ACREMY_07800 [bacterium]